MNRSIVSVVGGTLVGMAIATGAIAARGAMVAIPPAGATLPMPANPHWSPGKGGGAVVRLGNGVRIPGGYGLVVPRVGGPGVGPLILDAQVQYKTKAGDTLIRVRATLVVDGAGYSGKPIAPGDIVSEYVTVPRFVKADEHINTVVTLYPDCPGGEERPLVAWIRVEMYDEVDQIWRSESSSTDNISKSS